MKFSESGESQLRLIQLETAEKMEKLNLKQHGSLVKKMLTTKSLKDINEEAQEIFFEDDVLSEMKKYGLTRNRMHQFIRDWPITRISPKNTFHLVQLSGTYGRLFLIISVALNIDGYGFDANVTKLTVKQ